MRRIVGEAVVVSLGSAAVGWLIGTVQHFIAVRIPFCGLSLTGDCGFGEAEFYLAFWEGGLIGAMLALPTGLIAWYGLLRRHATTRQIASIVLCSLVGGCAAGAVISVMSALVTPFLTLAATAIVSGRSSSD